MFKEFKFTMSKVAAFVIICAAIFGFEDDVHKIAAFGIAAGMLGAKQLIERKKDV